MNTRTITQRIQAQEVTEGAGVQVFRSLGTAVRKHLDPFLMLDQFSTDNPDDYSAGFPEHPHRGFNTFTYMLDGHMQHGDSMGNRGDLGPGGAQWMRAASGIIHSEMPLQSKGRMRGFQLWVNLPASAKMGPPAYQEIRPDAIPEIDDGNIKVHLLAGEYGGRQGPVQDPHTQAKFLDVSLTAGTKFDHELPAKHTAFLYLFEGDAQAGSEKIETQQLAVLSDGDKLSIIAGPNGARFLLLAGRPLDEPIVQHGPFVMNTRDEIDQALADLRDGKLVREKAVMNEMGERGL